MTTQDWLPWVAADDGEPGPPRTRWGRWLRIGAGAVVLVVALVAVLLGAHDLAAAPPPTAAPVPAPVASGSAPPPPPSPTVIRIGLTDTRVTGGQRLADLVVDAMPLEGTVAPDRVADFSSCQADGSALQYLPVVIEAPELWLSATLTVEQTASTPPLPGRLGLFFQSGRASTPCPGGVWSPSDSFQASNVGQSRITGYVVLDQAFTAATPRGRADVFSTLQLRVSDVRVEPTVPVLGPLSVGSLCPGTENELCALLG